MTVSLSKLEDALSLAKQLQPLVLSRKSEERMLMDQFPAKTTRAKPFTLDR